MSSILDKYKVFYNDKVIGYYYIYSNHKATYYTEWGCPWDMEDTLKELGLEKELQETNPLKVFTDLINDANRVPGRTHGYRGTVYSLPARRKERDAGVFAAFSRCAALRRTKNPGRNARMGFLVCFQQDG